MGKLLLYRSADLFSAVFSGFRKSRIFLPCFPHISPRQRQPIQFTKLVNNGFQFLPRFIQKGNILGETDIYRAQVASMISVPRFAGRSGLSAGSICIPDGWLKSKKVVCILSRGLYIAFRLHYWYIFKVICMKNEWGNSFSLHILYT